MAAVAQFRVATVRAVFMTVRVREGQMQNALKFFRLVGWMELNADSFPLGNARFVSVANHGFITFALVEALDEDFGEVSPSLVMGISVRNVEKSFEALREWAAEPERDFEVDVYERGDGYIAFYLPDIFTTRIMFIP